MTKFIAHSVEAFENYYSEDFVVFNIFFEESDPEAGGQSWNLQRALGNDKTLDSLGEEDEGVCIVKEVQQVVLYEAIESAQLSRNRFVCIFDRVAAKKAGTGGIDVSFSIDDERWTKLKAMAELVFLGRNYFSLA